MKALLSRAPGGVDTLHLEDVASPEPGAGEVLVHVHACAINYPDALIIEDKYQIKPPRPFAPGGEVAGVVIAVGPDTGDFKVGDRVASMPLHGGLAQELLLPAIGTFAIPDTMPFADASALLMTYGTVWHALTDRAAAKNGETMLVLGAAGGIGIAAIDLGRALGLRVVAAVSSEQKAQVCRERGAHATIVYPAGPLDKDGKRALGAQFKEVLGSGGADIIFDPVGGDYAEPALRSIAWEGRYLIVGFPAGIPDLPFNLPLLKGCQIIGVFTGAFVEKYPDRNRANVEALMALYEQGAFRPLISETYPFDQAQVAITRLSSRKAVGKIVVAIEDELV